jgi:dTDP-4-dehydrorhamnose reductase
MTPHHRAILCIGKHGQVAQAVKRVANTLHADICFMGRDTMDLMQDGAAHTMITALKPSVIINTAAYTLVDKAQSEPAAAYRLNCEAAREIAIASAQVGAKLLHLSTDYVFSGKKEGAYLPLDTTDPLSVYGQSKCAGEQAVMSACPTALIIRTSWIFSQNSPNFVRTMLRLALSNTTIRVVDDQFGCPTFGDDLAAGLIKLSRAQHSAGVFHLAGQGVASWAQLAQFVFATSAEMGGPHAHVAPIPTSQYPTPAPRPPNSCLDSSHMSDLFGITLPHWQSGVRTCLAQIQQTGWANI